MRDNSGCVRIALMGAGARGDVNLATIAKRHRDRIRFVAVAEANAERREQFAQRFAIPEDHTFETWQELLDRPRLADAVINTLPCRLHYDSGLAALRAGYHLLLEKPMALTPAQCIHLVQVGEELDRVFMVSLQCRYNDIYQRMRSHLDQGTIGRLMNIDCAENVGYWHFIMSYVRGIHHRASDSHSFVMAKGVHDIDLISWFAGAQAKRVSSFGERTFFREEHAPPGAPEACLDGCPVEEDCVFSAIKQYVKPGQPDIPFSLFTGMSWGVVRDFLKEPRFRTLASVITHDLSREGRLRALRETPHGRCVFRSDNDVVDHQTVSIEYENDVEASFSLSGFSLLWERTCHLHGTAGEMRSADFSGRLELRTYRPARVRRNRIRYHGIIHGGGDEILLLDFADAVATERTEELLLSAKNCLDAHLVCFAAEEARQSHAVIDMDEFWQRSKAEADSLRS